MQTSVGGTRWYVICLFFFWDKASRNKCGMLPGFRECRRWVCILILYINLFTAVVC